MQFEYIQELIPKWVKDKLTANLGIGFLMNNKSNGYICFFIEGRFRKEFMLWNIFCINHIIVVKITDWTNCECEIYKKKKNYWYYSIVV